GSYDPDGDELSYRWDFDGDGRWDTEFSTSGMATHEWADEYSGTVYMQAFDGRLTDVCSVSLDVANVDPEVSLTGDHVVAEGHTATIDIDIQDTGSLDSFSVELDWGDGNVETISVPTNDRYLTVTHDYVDDDPTGTPHDEYTVTARVWDDDGGYGSTTKGVWVDNFAAEVTRNNFVKPNPYFILPLVHTVEFAASFTDIGVLDTHTAVWSWGDTTSENGVVFEADGSGTVAASHSWSVAGTYTVRLTVTDDDTEDSWVEWRIVVVSAQDAIGIVDDYIQELPNPAFAKNAKAVLDKKGALHVMALDMIAMIDDGDYNSALNSMIRNFESKMDGLPTYKNSDWIVTKTDQANLCSMLDDIEEYLSLMI
ncbi:MAG TPA: PKD domain-containing protein, partial [Methanomassiliicoccales archaeon]|nr:PKD domain-containing protein [Methanomassiliicoccales archaeon]